MASVLPHAREFALATQSICLEINNWQLSIGDQHTVATGGALKTLGQTRSRAEAAPFDRERFASGLGA